ncbi:MAG TPA: hypothetical protein VF755_28860 [Catenuloplanes sp.]|jgi:hypothetical protein
MRIADEDLGPQWLRDYRSIEADVSQMEEFAAKLAAEVQDNYATHLPYVSESMTTPLPQVSGNFPELLEFMLTHRRAQDATQTNVYNYRDGTGSFATAAQKISENYSGSDAFAQARVSDVTRALGPAGPGRSGVDTGPQSGSEGH